MKCNSKQNTIEHLEDYNVIDSNGQVIDLLTFEKLKNKYNTYLKEEFKLNGSLISINEEGIIQYNDDMFTNLDNIIESGVPFDPAH